MELVRGCAESGGGKSYFISDSATDLQAKVIDALAKAFEPCLSELQASFTSPEDVTFISPKPDEVPLIYAGEMFTQFLQLNDKFEDGLKMTLSFRNLKSGSKEKFTFQLQRALAQQGDSVFKMMAKRRIYELDKLDD